MKYILTLSVFIGLFLAASPASAQFSFDDWDYNDDDIIEYEEFEQGLTDSEYFSEWDTDGDGILTEDDWDAGTETWDDYDGDSEFSDWDMNDDGELTEDEFKEGFWDILDDDDNDEVDEDEWSVFDSEDDGLI